MQHRTSPRNLGRLVAAVLVGAALVAPSATLATGKGNPPSVECAGYAYFLKIDELGDAGIAAGDYVAAADWPGQVITISSVSNGGQDFSWTSTMTVSRIVAKEGNDSHLSTSGLPGTSGTVASVTKHALSHVTFCGDAAPVATPTPTATATETPVVTPTPAGTLDPVVTPTPGATGTPQPEETGTPTTTKKPESTPKGTGVAKSPGTTMPPTDGVGEAGRGSTGSGLPLVLLALAGLALGASLLRPAGQRARR